MIDKPSSGIQSTFSIVFLAHVIGRIIIIIIYHDFLPPPRRGSHVKIDNTHKQSLTCTP